MKRVDGLLFVIIILPVYIPFFFLHNGITLLFKPFSKI